MSDISNWHDQIYYINDIDLDRLTDENIDLTLRDLINEYVKTFFVSPDLKKFVLWTKMERTLLNMS